MKIKLKDFIDEYHTFDIGNEADIEVAILLELSGDEILKVVYKDNRMETYDSADGHRLENLFDGMQVAFIDGVWYGSMKKRIVKEEKETNNYDNIDTVCFDCAKQAGFVPSKEVFGMWVAKCEVCGETKGCSSLHHDWKRK